MNKTIGILYICTGPYYLFWKDFFESFEKNFLREYKKIYFVFTDNENVYQCNNPRVKVIPIKNLPWPLITLFRFNYFLQIEDELSECDYLMFSNANMICGVEIKPNEFLPRENKGEKISVTLHPGYYAKSKLYYPYERNKKSKAYIPWNCGEKYVIGAMYCGVRQDFLKMSKELSLNIEEDLKNNIIASWHDESHLNRYILNKNKIRFLSPEYCFPVGMNVNYSKKIYAVSKEDKFDIRAFKGQYIIKQNRIERIICKLRKKLMLKEYIFFIYDFVTMKKVGDFHNGE